VDAKTYFERLENGKLIDQYEKSSELYQPTGLNKYLYLDIIEKVIDAYGTEYLWKMATGKIEFVICIGLRASGAIAYLLSEERRLELYDLWISLMHKSCDQFLVIFDHAEYDLAVKEMMIAFKLMKNKLKKEDYQEIYRKLKSIDPYKTYHCIIKNQKDKSKLCNMTVYNAAGEYLRESEGMTDTKTYFDEHMPWATSRFDPNGMWDPLDHALLYDLTTRCQFSVMLHYGYNGQYREIIDENLAKGGMMTLMMQSAAFQLPYGGRSNQYLFNEALVASCCEYEAARYMKANKPILAGMFKRCAHKSAQTVYERLNESTSPQHIKNYFNVSEAFGIDGYGTFHRYLITVAVFIGYGFLFADETIEEHACPSEIGGYVLETSDRFHKIFANCAGQSIEIETMADCRYDSSGLGRYHRFGYPIDLALSIPMTAEPKYHLPVSLVRKNISICSGIRFIDGSILRISDLKDNLTTCTNIIEESEQIIRFSIDYRSTNEKMPLHIKEVYTINNEGVSIKAIAFGQNVKSVVFTIPVFITNGKDTSNITVYDSHSGELSENIVDVLVGPYMYTVHGNSNAIINPEQTANRNGIYQTIEYEKCGNQLNIHLCLHKKSA